MKSKSFDKLIVLLENKYNNIINLLKTDKDITFNLRNNRSESCIMLYYKSNKIITLDHKGNITPGEKYKKILERLKCDMLSPQSIVKFKEEQNLKKKDELVFQSEIVRSINSSDTSILISTEYTYVEVSKEKTYNGVEKPGKVDIVSLEYNDSFPVINLIEVKYGYDAMDNATSPQTKEKSRKKEKPILQFGNGIVGHFYKYGKMILNDVMPSNNIFYEQVIADVNHMIEFNNHFGIWKKNISPITEELTEKNFRIIFYVNDDLARKFVLYRITGDSKDILASGRRIPGSESGWFVSNLVNESFKDHDVNKVIMYLTRDELNRISDKVYCIVDNTGNELTKMESLEDVICHISQEN